MKIKLAENIKYNRKRHGLTQGELAAKLFSKKSLISNYENGYSTPDIYTICRLAKIFDVTLDELVEFDDGVNNPSFFHSVCARFGAYGEGVRNINIRESFMTARKARILVILGNIVICTTVAALLFVTMTPFSAKPVLGDSEPYYSGSSEKNVSLMVNVYWGTEYIKPMLEIFDRYGVKTTFFVGGSWVAANELVLRDIVAAGHEIGNHGYYHKDHKKLDAAYNRKEIQAAHDAVKTATGIDMTLFAPPSGSFGAATLSVATELGYRTVMWTRDTIDWRDHDSDLIYKRAVKNVKGGDLILMHPTECTVKALERILDGIFAAGLSVAPVGAVLDEMQ